MNELDYCIIGSSAAAAGAVEGVRAVDPSGTLAVITEETVPFYSRPLITRVMTGAATALDVAYRPRTFLDENRVLTYIGEPVVRLDPADRRIILASGKELRFRKALVATGNSPKLPPLPGLNLRGVHTLMSLADAEAIAADLGLNGLNGPGPGPDPRPRVSSVVVIGGGLIGLQAAEALCSMGLRVTVVEGLARLLATVLDQTTSTMVADIFALHGVTILTSRSVKALRAGRADPDRVGSVVLADGTELPADLVILATGVRPRTEILETATGGPGRGFRVDGQMATDDPEIYAAGDAAEVPDLLRGGARPFPIWPTAYAGGRVAGLNMAGRRAALAGQVAMNTFHFFGLAMASAGLVEPPGAGDGGDGAGGGGDGAGDGGEYEILATHRPPGVPGRLSRPSGPSGPSPGETYYRKLVLRKGCLVGLVCVGEAVDRAGLAVSLIRQGVEVESFKEELLGSFSLAGLPEEIRAKYLSGEGVLS